MTRLNCGMGWMATLTLVACLSAWAMAGNADAEKKEIKFTDVALKDVKMDFAKLKDFGTRKYKAALLRKQDPRSLFAPPVMGHTMKTVVTAKGVTFQDTFSITLKIGKMSTIVHELTYECNLDNFLSLVSCDMKSTEDGEPFRSATGRVVDEKLTMTRKKPDGTTSTKTTEHPKNSADMTALIRIVTLLPREAGRRYTGINNVSMEIAESEEAKTAPSQRMIECHGAEKLEESKGAMWTRYRILPTKKNTTRDEFVDIWVNEKGVVHKINVDGITSMDLDE